MATNVTLTSNKETDKCIDDKKVQQQICVLVEKTIKEKYAEEQSRFKHIVSKTVTETVGRLQDQMLALITANFDAKLEVFYNQVNNSTSSDIIDKIISEIGIRFDKALNDKRDIGNVTSYGALVKGSPVAVGGGTTSPGLAKTNQDIAIKFSDIDQLGDIERKELKRERAKYDEALEAEKSLRKRSGNPGNMKSIADGCQISGGRKTIRNRNKLSKSKGHRNKLSKTKRHRNKLSKTKR
jgi:hypothetical protein